MSFSKKMNLQPDSKVVILMATYNGVTWIKEQVDSILSQKQVSVRLLVSDDNSTDGTYEWLVELASSDSRVTLLPQVPNKQLGAAHNFYRLMSMVDINEGWFYALSDQDDIWRKDKLIKQVTELRSNGYSATSSNVNAFWEDGRKMLINKAQAQQEFDYFFESAGPGCSYCFNDKVMQALQTQVQNSSWDELPELHDWFIYALCRFRDFNWYISPEPLLDYRQHSENEFGAHYGWRARVGRFKSISAGWYKTEVIKLTKLCESTTGGNNILCKRLKRLSVQDRLYLIYNFKKLRRKKSESIFLAILIALYIY